MSRAAKEKEDKKKQRDMMKALETPEEKRARRLAKKEAKEKKRREKMGWSEEYMGYTNADNPFGDNNLLGTFKWQKVSWRAVFNSFCCVSIIKSVQNLFANYFFITWL